MYTMLLLQSVFLHSRLAVLEADCIQVCSFPSIHCNYISTVFNEQAALSISIWPKRVSNVTVGRMLGQEG